MAAVPIEFSLSAAPAKGITAFTAVLQVRSRQGFTTVRTVRLDGRGRATGTIVSNRAGTREYRAALLSAKGRVVAASAPVVVTWARLEHAVALRCDSISSPVAVDVPCRIDVTPAVRLDDMVVSLQFLGSTDWLNLDNFTVPDSGRIATNVSGRTARSVDYRVQLLRGAQVIAQSSVVTIAYSDPAD